MEKEKLEILRVWLDRFQKSYNAMEPMRNAGRENYRLYRSYQQGKEQLYKHNIFVPYSFAFMEDLSAFYLLALAGLPKVYSISPRGAGISTETCMAMEELLNWCVTDERAEFILELEEMLKHLNLYSIAYLIEYPILTSVRDMEIADFGGLAPRRTSLDHMFFDAPHPFLVYPEPGPKRLSRANWVIKQSFETLDTIREWARIGIYEDISELENGDITSERDPVYALLSEIGLSPVEYNQNKIELLDCLADGDVITIANRRAIIRDTTKDSIKPYAFRFPILDCRLSGAPGEFIGIGAIEAIKPLQKELNLLRSQRRENVSLLLNKLFKYDMLAGEVDLTTVFSAPGNIIITQGDCLHEFPVSDVTASSYQEESALVYDIQNVLSLWDYSRGATPKRRETATGIVKLQEASKSRVDWHLKKLDQYILQPLARRMLVHLREYLSENEAIEIAGPALADGVRAFFSMPIENLTRLVGVKPLTESLNVQKELDLNLFIQAFDRLARMPGINIMALAKALLYRIGYKDFKEILNNPATQQQAQMAQAVQGVGGPEAMMQGMSARATPEQLVQMLKAQAAAGQQVQSAPEVGPELMGGM